MRKFEKTWIPVKKRRMTAFFPAPAKCDRHTGTYLAGIQAAARLGWEQSTISRLRIRLAGIA
jgi:hypothetical protein